MNRRIFLSGSLAALTPIPFAHAQQLEAVYRIGFLSGHKRRHDVSEHLPAALREIGYVENRNLVIEWRWGDGQLEAVPGLLADLVRSKVAVITVLGNDAIAVARRGTTIPIVMAGASHPVEMGFVDSLAHPGGTVTGFAYNPIEVAGKLVEVLKEAFPKLLRIAVIWNPELPGMTLYQPAMYQTAAALGVRLQWVAIRKPSDATTALESVRSGNADALYVVNDTVVSAVEQHLLAFIGRHRLPAIFTARQWIDVGGLLYYGPNVTELWRRAAYYIDRILKGTRPADLPVEQPARLELVINAKTARLLGLTIAPAVLARADRVIE